MKEACCEKKQIYSILLAMYNKNTIPAGVFDGVPPLFGLVVRGWQLVKYVVNFQQDEG